LFLFLLYDVLLLCPCHLFVSDHVSRLFMFPFVFLIPG
jgi:hypothetical protein